MKSSSKLVDSFGRAHTYLRMSLTEKCNLRCTYCMPEQGVNLTSRDQIMTFEERKRAINLFSDMGISKLRFTGGEPTVSNQLLELVMHAKQKIENISITSNGILLKDRLDSLVSAGLGSVNISLDTLVEEKFARITRRDGKLLRKVLSSIYGAVARGLPVKINCVIVRGLNDDESGAFVRLSEDMPIDIRFIELMPFDGTAWDPKSFVGYMELLDKMRIEEVGPHFPPLLSA
jgi:molybdenum cofactor biosynthesis enzyme MoaA